MIEWSRRRRRGQASIYYKLMELGSQTEEKRGIKKKKNKEGGNPPFHTTHPRGGAGKEDKAERVRK